MPRFQPNLGVPIDLAQLVFPCLGSPKLDGIRCINNDEYAYPCTRTLLPVPNRFIKACFDTARFYHTTHGLDGELIVGPPNAPDVYNHTQSGVMSAGGEPVFTYYVFDKWDVPTGFASRQFRLAKQVELLDQPWIKILEQRWLHDITELLNFEEEQLSLGFEGIVTRAPTAPYKFGRSTMAPINRRTKVVEQGLVKVKRMADAEGRIVGWKQRRINANPATTDERGYAKRATHAENMIEIDDLGAWIVEAVNGDFAGVTFDCAVGKTSAAERLRQWQNRADYLHQLITFTYFPIGSKDKPRMPRFKGIRSPEDM